MAEGMILIVVGHGWQRSAGQISNDSVVEAQLDDEGLEYVIVKKRTKLQSAANAFDLHRCNASYRDDVAASVRGRKFQLGRRV